MLEKSFFLESQKSLEELSTLIKQRIATILNEGKINYSEIQVGLSIVSAQNGGVQGRAVIRVELYDPILPAQGGYLFSVIPPIQINFFELEEALSSPNLIKSFVIAAGLFSREQEMLIAEEDVINYFDRVRQAIDTVKNLK